jgi:dolichyl-phosphate beta-glucosyltransferase
MRRRLRRFAVVTVVITAVDVGVLWLARLLGWHVLAADLAAVLVASVVSFALHRALTFADDPHVRWVRQPRAFLATASVAGAVDVAVTTAIVAVAPVAVAKGFGLLLAGGVRAVAYRAVLLTDMRRDLRARKERPLPPGAHRFTVVMPAFQEEERVAASVATVQASLADLDVEVVVADDGSTDRTADRAEAAGATVVRLPSNRGKGAAVRAGVLASTGSVVAFTDVDLAYPPEQLRDLLVAVESGWDVAVGNRWHPDSQTIARPSVLRQASSRFFNALTATVLLGQYRDTQCGCKAFRADVARDLFGHTLLDGFAFDVEVLHLVERYRLSLTEVPVSVRDGGVSSVRVGSVAVGMVRDLFRVRRWGSEGRYDRGR